MIQITLEAARVNAGYTLESAAKAVNISQQTLINWEKGRTEPTIGQAREIAKLYGIPLDNIIFLTAKSN